MVKRNKLEIIKDILDIIKSHHGIIRLTPLLRKSNLSSKRFYEYLEEMIKKELVNEIKKGDTKEIKITEKGYKYIERFQIIISFIDEFEL